ncbi:MAG: bifunctional diguanylate cyclase/phosphohydrolase [Saccharofermentanales bacterium]
MNNILSIGIINNAALLLALSGVNEISYYVPKRFIRYKPVISGILISMICLIIMSVPFTIRPGLFYDTRSILISITALIFGFIPTLIVAAVAIIYRILIGGVGALAGISVIISSAFIGLAWKRWLYPRRPHLRWLNVYAMSILVHATMLACMLLLPAPENFTVIRAISIPVMLVYPVASILLSILIIRQIEHRKVQEQLRSSEEKYIDYIENAPDGIFVADENGRYIEVNKAALRITGYTKDELLNMSLADITSPESIINAYADFESLKNNGYLSVELQFIHKDGSTRWWTVDAVKLAENRFLGFSSDITDRKEADEMLLYVSTHDSLTGLYNRRHFDREIERIDKTGICPLSVVIGDINGLKLINDAFGRKEGDRIIINTARLFQDNCGPEDIVCRTGGDEFSIIMPSADKESAYEMLKKIQSACDVYNRNVSYEAFRISISLGCGTKTDKFDNSKNMIRIAEQYLSQRKLLEIKSSHNAILSSIKATMIEKSHETESHAERLVFLTRPIGIALDLSQVDMDHLELLATLHDIGKVGISDQILNKNGDLTADEWIEMKKHPEAGYRITSASLEFAPIADYILNHHERWDGEGYPQGISGEDIPLLSRIIAVADSYDAMTQERSYQKAMTHEEALDEVLRCSGTQFDPNIVKIFYETMTKT